MSDNECKELTFPPQCSSDEETTIRERPGFRYLAVTRRVLQKHAWINSVPLAASLMRTFGVFSVTMFALCYFFSKGIASHLLSSALLPLFKDVLGLESTVYQKILAVGVMAWSMKPIIGIVSDSVSVAGFHRRWLLTCACVTCAACFVFFATFPGGRASSPVLLVAAVLFVANFCCAILDLLPEAMYSEMIARVPSASSAVVSWVWAFVMAGGATAAILQGPLSDAGLSRGAFAVGFAAQAALVVPMSRNWFCERRSRCEDKIAGCLSWRKDLWQSHPRLVALCLLMAFGSLLLACSTLLVSRWVLLVVSAATFLILSFASFQVLPAEIASANLFMFLKELLYIQLPGPMDYFYTASEECLPHGPHFSYSFYQTFTVIVGYIAGLGGVAVFHSYFASKRMRFVFFATTSIKIAASLVDIAIINRWNVRYLGLSDTWSYFLGDTIVFGACQMLDFMPAVILTSQLCPRGLEATMYAVLAGFMNLGQAMSNNCGALLVEFIWPIQTAPPCNFDNLGMLVVFGHCLLPMLVIPLAMWLLPDRPLSGDEDDLSVDGD